MPDGNDRAGETRHTNLFDGRTIAPGFGRERTSGGCGQLLETTGWQTEGTRYPETERAGAADPVSA